MIQPPCSRAAKPSNAKTQCATGTNAAHKPANSRMFELFNPVGHRPEISATVMIANISWNATTRRRQGTRQREYSPRRSACSIGSNSIDADETFETPVLARAAGDVVNRVAH